jgi:Ser/Thr protein kinase RdoA (MazF antagonist)
MMEKLDPILAACKLIKGYTNDTKLIDNEIAVLDILIRSRLAISVLVSAEKRSNGVTDPLSI